MGDSRETRQDQLQHFMKNAFHHICFGGDPHGIHGCTPVDIMHTLLHGIYKYVQETFFEVVGSACVTVLDKIVIALGN